MVIINMAIYQKRKSENNDMKFKVYEIITDKDVIDT